MMTNRQMIGTQEPQHVTKRRGWPLAGVLAGATGAFGTVMGVSPVSEAAAESGGAAILAEIQADRLPTALGAIAGMAALVCVTLFAAGLRQRLARPDPESPVPTVAVAGLALTGASLFVGLAATYQLWWQAGGAYDGADLVAAAFLIADTVSFAAWAGVGLTAAAVAVSSLRYAALPRWLGWFSVAVAFVIGAMSIGMVPFMAFVPASLWLIVAGVGLHRSGSRR